ncbi:MAG: hypothetical protein JHD16_09955 [Solirubrobacteraceae bacterium]|nr:hypothetical protein [Solirubrobacteraceae bacterium]
MDHPTSRLVRFTGGVSASENEQHPAGYDWRTRFPEVQLVKRTVDVEVYLAYEGDAFWLIVDETSIAESLHPEDDADILSALVTIERHEDTRSLLPVLQSRGVGVGDLERALRAG